MKKNLLSPVTALAFLFALVSPHIAFSQDDIIMRNDNVTKARVDEVDVDVIKYHKSDNLDGPMYVLPKADVYMIVYANGSRDVINPRGESPAPQEAAVPEATIRVAPPEMPVYEQPLCPMEGYLWTPGYWGYGRGGYFWVPGVWVSPPHMGYLWTPGYWGYNGGFYGWHEGYWGEHIGFYGGVNYGYGYGGSGYYGGRWEGGYFRYNTAVSRVDVEVVHTTYVDHTIVNNTVVNHSSYNGEGGVRAEPTSSERAAASETHVRHTEEQHSHVAAARNDKNQYVSANNGKPAITAINKPNGQALNSEGHITTNSLHTSERSAVHTTPAEQHTTPAASHPAETSQPQRTETRSTPNEQHTQPQHIETNTPRSTPAEQHMQPQRNETNTPRTMPNEQHSSQPAPARQAQPQRQAPVQQSRPAPRPASASKPAPARNEHH